MKKLLKEGNEKAEVASKAEVWVRDRDGRYSVGEDQAYSAAGAQGEQRHGEEKAEIGKHDERRGANVASLVSPHFFFPSPINFCSFLSVSQAEAGPRLQPCGRSVSGAAGGAVGLLRGPGSGSVVRGKRRACVLLPPRAKLAIHHRSAEFQQHEAKNAVFLLVYRPASRAHPFVASVYY